MNKLLFTSLISLGFLVLSACGNNRSNHESRSIADRADSTQTSESTNKKSDDAEVFALGEKALGPVILPFWQLDTKAELERLLPDFTIKPENAVAEGGEFKVYHLNLNDKDVASFEMRMDDSTYLHQLVLHTAEIADEYGLKVGDAYGKIKEKRADAPKAKMGYHFRTYVEVPGSHISYELHGDYKTPEGLTLETIEQHEYSEEDLQNFKISAIIWSDQVSK